jgi:hypothetical protein
MRGREVPQVRWERIQGDLETLGCEEPGEECGERVPCADESCIGALGADGCCAVCGRTGAGVDETPDAAALGEESDEAMAEAASAPEVDRDDAEEEDDGEDVEERLLCADEACIGLVAEDGYCRMCGLRWKPEGYEDGESWVYRGDAGQ